MSTLFFPFLRVTSIQNDSYQSISTSGTVDYLPPLEPDGDYPPTKLWSDDSYWYMRIKENPTLHPNSDEMVDWLLANHAKYPGIQWKSWTNVVYDAYEDTPVYSVYDESSGTYKNIPFPDPYPIQIPLESDHSVTIQDWYGGYVWDLWNVRATGGTYVVGDVWAFEIGGDGLAPLDVWSTGGSGTVTGAYLIRPEEIEAGVIYHPLACALRVINYPNRYSTTQNFVYPPASHSDRANLAGYAIPEGARIQLDPAIDLDSLGLSSTGKIIAKCMQDYGIVATEAGGSWHIYAEHDFTAHWNPPKMSGGLLRAIGDLVTLTYSPWRIIDSELYPSIDNLSEYESPAP